MGGGRPTQGRNFQAVLPVRLASDRKENLKSPTLAPRCREVAEQILTKPTWLSVETKCNPHPAGYISVKEEDRKGVLEHTPEGRRPGCARRAFGGERQWVDGDS